jgi:hypothetical protein
MGYEIFQRGMIRVAEPTLSVTPAGKIVLNAGAARNLAEAGIKSVLLLWDKVSNKFALRAAQKADANAYKVSVAPNKPGGTLAAKSFLNHIGWSARKRQTLPATWNEKEKMLEVTLPREYLGAEARGVYKRKTKANS